MEFGRCPRWARALVLAVGLGVLGVGGTGCFPGRGFVAIGTAIDILPHGFVTVSVGTSRYYYHRGMFYRPYRGGFLVIPAPVGVLVPAPPPGHVVVLVENDPFAYYRGVFYAPRNQRWMVVRAPMGAFVRALPREAVTRRVAGVEYKEYAGVWYRPAIRDGDRGYQVAERPTGGP